MAHTQSTAEAVADSNFTVLRLPRQGMDLPAPSSTTRTNPFHWRKRKKEKETLNQLLTDSSRYRNECRDKIVLHPWMRLIKFRYLMGRKIEGDSFFPLEMKYKEG